ncbi:MAG TPA: methyltransferase domain-containing protein [Solirubrobacteraceae bacterium]|nr:methyltransferase domain-containing protein [Solirubrobacteraceae bacterium]
MSSRDWDAATYDRISAPQQAWAAEQLDRLELAGDEVVVDAGCGSGKITAELVRRVPRGMVYAVDVAPSMVRYTEQALGDSVTALCQDLTELDLPEPVDVVFSNATFHWIGDHDALFAALHRNMKPGARLLAQCGGRGNIDSFRTTADLIAGEEPFAEFFAGWQRPWNYATDTDTERRLHGAGYADISCWLEPKRVTPEDARAFVRTVCLVRHLDPLPEELRDEFVDRVLARSGNPLVLEYVRLNMSAVRV